MSEERAKEGFLDIPMKDSQADSAVEIRRLELQFGLEAKKIAAEQDARRLEQEKKIAVELQAKKLEQEGK